MKGYTDGSKRLAAVLAINRYEKKNIQNRATRRRITGRNRSIISAQILSLSLSKKSRRTRRNETHTHPLSPVSCSSSFFLSSPGSRELPANRGRSRNRLVRIQACVRACALPQRLYIVCNTNTRAGARTRLWAWDERIGARPSLPRTRLIQEGPREPWSSSGGARLTSYLNGSECAKVEGAVLASAAADDEERACAVREGERKKARPRETPEKGWSEMEREGEHR